LEAEPVESLFDLGGLTSLEWFVEGLRQALTGPAFFVAIAMVGVGGLARGAGFPFGAAVASAARDRLRHRWCTRALSHPDLLWVSAERNLALHVGIRGAVDR
jgi:hypothetical protein